MMVYYILLIHVLLFVFSLRHNMNTIDKMWYYVLDIHEPDSVWYSLMEGFKWIK